MEKKKCCFSGHRPQNLPFGSNENDQRCVALKNRLKAEIVRMITEYNVGYFISGMALGVDTYAAEIVLSLKKVYPFLKLECALPDELQAEKWREPDRDRYFSIIERCDRETLIQTRFTPECFEKSNHYMVDHSDFVIAVWNKKPSGTGNTVRYAQKQGKSITVIDPEAATPGDYDNDQDITI